MSLILYHAIVNDRPDIRQAFQGKSEYRFSKNPTILKRLFFCSRNSRSGNPSGAPSFGSRSGRNVPPTDIPHGSSGSRGGSNPFVRTDRPPLLQPPSAGLLPIPNSVTVTHNQQQPPQPLVDPYYVSPTGHNDHLNSNHRYALFASITYRCSSTLRSLITSTPNACYNAIMVDEMCA